MAGPFKMKGFSGFGNSPLKDSGHGGKKGHGHTTVFGTKVEDIGKNIKKAAKGFWEHKDPFPNIHLGKDLIAAGKKYLGRKKYIGRFFREEEED